MPRPLPTRFLFEVSDAAYLMETGDGESRGSSKGFAGMGSGLDMLRRMRLRLRRLHRIIATSAVAVAITMPITTNTPATAPPFAKNLKEDVSFGAHANLVLTTRTHASLMYYHQHSIFQ